MRITKEQQTEIENELFAISNNLKEIWRKYQLPYGHLNVSITKIGFDGELTSSIDYPTGIESIKEITSNGLTFELKNIWEKPFEDEENKKLI